MRTSSKIAVGLGAGAAAGGAVLGIVLIVIGVLLSLTLIGAIIGIPLIIVGLLIIFGGWSTGALMGAGAVTQEAIDEYYKERGHICAHCGGPLKGGQIYFCKKRHFVFETGFDIVPVCKKCSKKCNNCGRYFCSKHIDNHRCK